MFDDFIIRAALAALGVALSAGPLGCFIVWRRMAYFGDATAHSAILGVALALAFSMSISIGVVMVALAVASFVAYLSGTAQNSDTLLGVISHSALATGLVAVAFLPDVRLDLMAYLFGDILTVSMSDVMLIFGGSFLVLVLLWRFWNALLISTTNPDLAYASGVNPRAQQLILNLAIALVIAVSIQVVGALLISAFLIIPAATARHLSKSPEAMAAWATGIAAVSGLSGLAVSFAFDTPTGPTIVCVASLTFIMATSLTAITR